MHCSKLSGSVKNSMHWAFNNLVAPWHHSTRSSFLQCWQQMMVFCSSVDGFVWCSWQYLIQISRGHSVTHGWNLPRAENCAGIVCRALCSCQPCEKVPACHDSILLAFWSFYFVQCALSDAIVTFLKIRNACSVTSDIMFTSSFYVVACQQSSFQNF